MRAQLPTGLPDAHAPLRTFLHCCWPAVFALLVESAQAHTFCVNSADAPADPEHGLRQALAAAADGGIYNGEINTIKIVRGTYSVLPTSSGGFTFTSTSGHKLDINGGYNSDCSALIEDPAFTILDGANQHRVLYTSSNADVSLRWVTLQNGYLESDGAGLTALLNAPAGELILNYSIIRNNVSTIAAGGVYIGGGGLVYLWDNLIVGNSASNVAALFVNSGGATVYLVNNTVTQNINSAPTSIDIALDGSGGDTVYASNNIFWGNTATTELDFGNLSSVYLANNDYSSIDNTPITDSNNQNVDPQFIGNGNYRLSPGSPLLSAGTTTPTGGLPTIDIAGYARTFNATVDLGAYERGDEIFRDNFNQ
jgi:hypothetical protein